MFPWALELCHSSAGTEGLKGHFASCVCVSVCLCFRAATSRHEAVPGGLQCRILLNLEHFSVMRSLNWSQHLGI